MASSSTSSTGEDLSAAPAPPPRPAARTIADEQALSEDRRNTAAAAVAKDRQDRKDVAAAKELLAENKFKRMMAERKSDTEAKVAVCKAEEERAVNITNAETQKSQQASVNTVNESKAKEGIIHAESKAKEGIIHAETQKSQQASVNIVNETKAKEGIVHAESQKSQQASVNIVNESKAKEGILQAETEKIRAETEKIQAETELERARPSRKRSAAASAATDGADTPHMVPVTCGVSRGACNCFHHIHTTSQQPLIIHACLRERDLKQIDELYEIVGLIPGKKNRPDGFVLDDDGNVVDVYLYHGNHYHGFPTGCEPAGWRGVGGATSAKLYGPTEDAMDLYAARGYNVYYIFEDSFKRSIKKRCPEPLKIHKWTLRVNPAVASSSGGGL